MARAIGRLSESESAQLRTVSFCCSKPHAATLTVGVGMAGIGDAMR